MNRFSRKIKGKYTGQLQVIILAAGARSRSKSYEPRCLLKYNNKTIIEHQIEAIQATFSKAEITVVCGIEKNKIIKKLGNEIRYVENQLFEETNSGESLRLGIFNSKIDDVLFIHGDVIIDEDIFKNINMSKSWLLSASNSKMEEKEVGIIKINNVATVMSYDALEKWCQIAYLCSNEMSILKKLFMRPEYDSKYLLTFEIINDIIENGGNFNVLDIGNAFIKEIDSLKDLNNEIIS